mgnify:CR=1 FL=1
MCPVTTTSVTRVVAGTAAAGAAALAWGVLVEPRLFTLRRFTVPVLPADALPVRILQVSDIHMVPGQQAKTEWIRGLAALEPDLVVNTGDNLSHLEAVPAALDALAPLLERPGVFVMGSNDYHAPVPKNPARYLTKDHAKVVGSRVELPTEELREGMQADGHAMPELEVIAWGRLPLSFSARCFTARALDVAKDQCGFRCIDYPDGMPLATREGRPFLRINGIQVQGEETTDLGPELPSLAALGVDLLRIYPQAEGTREIVERFDAARDASTALPLVGARNGDWHGEAGMTLAGHGAGG